MASTVESDVKPIKQTKPISICLASSFILIDVLTVPRDLSNSVATCTCLVSFSYRIVLGACPYGVVSRPCGLSRRHWLHAVSHHCLGSNPGLGMWERCQWLGVRRWFSPGPPVSSTIYRHNWHKCDEKTKFQIPNFLSLWPCGLNKALAMTATCSCLSPPIRVRFLPGAC